VVLVEEEEGEEGVVLASRQADHCFIPRGPSNDRACNAWGDNEFLLYPGPYTPVPLRLLSPPLMLLSRVCFVLQMSTFTRFDRAGATMDS
jgi:hypothetical protein